MKKGLLGLLLLLAAIANSELKAQYVTIPDANFVSWLQARYPQCMQGNQMDTTCPAIINETIVNCSSSNINDISGIQYFDNLDSLKIQINNITELSNLPNTLEYLNCYENQINSIDRFPVGLKYFEAQDNDLTLIPALPASLEFFSAGLNNLSQLPTLPQGLLRLLIGDNQFVTLPALPNSLVSLRVNNNNLTSLPAIPTSLSTINCSYNALTQLPTFNNALRTIICSNNQLSNIPSLPITTQQLDFKHNNVNIMPVLPNNLKTLDCSANPLTAFPSSLPPGMISLVCTSNNLDSLPPLPNTMNILFCDSNNLVSLPTLPSAISFLVCTNNHLTTLPPLPSLLSVVLCGNNDITSLPALPNVMTRLNLNNNPISCLPPLTAIEQLEFQGTNVSCLPNYGQVLLSYPSLSTLPLCGTFNTKGCQAFFNVSGKGFISSDTSCVYGANDIDIYRLKVQLFENGQVLQQAFTGGEGFYSFDLQNTPGSYVTSIDSTFLPFTISCPDTGYYTSVVTATDTSFYNKDFALKCKQGFDIGAFGVYRSPGFFRPASFHTINIIAGDIAQLYGASCTSIPGQVKVVMTGNASIQAYPNLPPTAVNGDTIIWDIADFSAINVFSAFVLEIQVDTLALDGDLVCFDVSVTPYAGDNNTANNYYSFCFPVQASYDPNNKEVYPSGDIDTMQEWLTYTINFQNTGSIPAEHIYLLDTLDANLDETTLQLVTYSHPNYTQVLEGGVVKFNFPNINLPDSLSDEVGSHGYVQYRIKLREGLPVGTTISNTAYIYFDFNAPVVTNTTLNKIALPEPNGISEKDAQTFNIFPNPTTGQLTVTASMELQGKTIIVYDLSGKQLLSEAGKGNASIINVASLANGMYLLVVEDGEYGVLFRDRIVVAH